MIFQGGFAYLHTDTRKSRFFPIVIPEENIDEDDDNVLGTEEDKPVHYDAPIHITKLSDKQEIWWCLLGGFIVCVYDLLDQ